MTHVVSREARRLRQFLASDPGASAVAHRGAHAGAVRFALSQFFGAAPLHSTLDFGCDPTGAANDGAKLAALLAEAASQRRPAIISGTPRTVQALAMVDRCELHFVGTWGNFSGNLPASYIVKDAALNGPALTVAGQGSTVRGGGVVGQPGNQGDGVVVLGNSVHWQGGYVQGCARDGWRIGEDATSIPNTNRFNLQHCGAASNGRDGFRVADGLAPGSAPNANAGTMLAPFSLNNGGHGLYADNSFGNLVLGGLFETNTGRGIFLDGRCVSWTFVGGDVEMNSVGTIQGQAGADVVLAPSVQAAGGLKGLNAFINVNVGTPPTDQAENTGRGWVGFNGFGAASGAGVINGHADAIVGIEGTTTAGVNTVTQNVAARVARNGRTCILTFDVSLAVKDAAMAGNVRLTGLPIPSTATLGGFVVTLMNGITLPAGRSMLGGSLNGSSIDLQCNGSNVAFSGLPVANIAQGARLSGFVVYLTAQG